MQIYVLFVDDEPAILNAIKRVFRKSPYKIMTTSDVEEALEIVRTLPVAVLVSDYSMPGITGAEMLAKAKSIRPDMTRIILSGNGDQEATIQSINHGSASRFLTKPWDDSELLAEIDKAIIQKQEQRYVCADKKLLGQNAFIETVEELSATNSEVSFAVAYFGIRDFEKVQQRVGIEKVPALLQHIVPSPELLEMPLAWAIMDDNHFCGVIEIERGASDANKEVRELIESFAGSTVFEEMKITLSMDAGYCVVSSEEDVTENIIGNAHTACQYAKSSDSENFVAYQSWMNEKKNNHQEIESHLQDALQNKEFILYYQPKINTLNGTMQGAEALIRWNSPSLGMVSPVDFIPLAERSDAINDIGEWVMHEAVRQWKEWFGLTAMQPVISVNVSPRQLKDANFIQRIENVLSEHRIDPSRLELEITESLMVEDIKSTIKILEDIKALGVGLSIDDFGTGYSSLSYLNQLPVDTMKIDRSFIFPMLEAKEKQDLVNNLIKLGHDMGIEIVAEGVEDEQQLQVLKEYGCDVIQGYFYSPPVCAEDYVKLIEKYPVSEAANDGQHIQAARSA